VSKLCIACLLISSLSVCQRVNSAEPADDSAASNASSQFQGLKAGDQRQVAGIQLCWCPPGRFTMGSPPNEPERRPSEDQVSVQLSKGFWTSKFEVTQGQWKRVVGPLPGKLTAELLEGDDYPVRNVNFVEAEAFCQRLTEISHQSGDLPGGTDPDLRSAKATATKSEHGDISRSRRGGCWADEGWACRTAFRLRFEPERRYDHIGFRIVAVPLENASVNAP
jgi:formylglycine-generating enzyme required for sulfatase activity